MEVWRDIVGYEGLYAVSNRGTVKSLARVVVYSDRVKAKRKEILLKARPDRSGYLRVRLYNDGIGKTFFVHRLVAIAFIPNPDKKPDINHRIGGIANRGLNHVENLEWTTKVDNALHGFRHGDRTVKKGSKSKLSKLDESKIVEIRRLLASGISVKKIAEMFSVSIPTISRIRSGETWGHVKDGDESPSTN